MIRGWGGGFGGGRSGLWVKKIEKKFPQEIINKKKYSYGFWPKEKKYAQGESVQVSKESAIQEKL